MALLKEALGTADFNFVYDLVLQQLASVSVRNGKIDEGKLNFLLSVVAGINPRDQIEAMLAAQMGAVHLAMMRFSRQLAHVETLQQQDSAERAFTRLARTFASQMETLKRYRTGGEQKVTVQHVSVNDGGQAVIGSVTQNTANVAPPPTAKLKPLLNDGSNTAMPVIEEMARDEVPLELKQKNVS